MKVFRIILTSYLLVAIVIFNKFNLSKTNHLCLFMLSKTQFKTAWKSYKKALLTVNLFFGRGIP